MRLDLRTIAARRYPQIANRKEREHAAETWLVEQFFGESFVGRFVEVGASDPVLFSQTHHLEQRGWTGVLIEPIAELADRLRRERPRSTVVQAACSAPADRGEADFHVASYSAQSTLRVGAADAGIAIDHVQRVRVITLDDALVEANLPMVDFISIDVEGLQLEVLQGFTLERWKPKLLMIEDHLHRLDTHRHISSRGYRLVKRTGLNNWYIPRGTPFTLTTPTERLKLARKLYLGTWLRGAKHNLRAAAE